LDLNHEEIDGWRVKQLAEELKNNQVTPQSIFLDSFSIVLRVPQFLRILNMQRNKLNPEKIQYLAEGLKINQVIIQYYFSSYDPSTFHGLTDTNRIGSSIE
jgi:hypothetical protein